MITWKAALVQALSQIGDLTALVGDRIAAGRRKSGDPLPAVVFQSNSNNRGHTLEAPDGLPTANVQIECYGRSDAEAEAVAECIRRPVAQGGLDGFRGDMHGLFVQSLLFEDGGRDDFIPSQANDAAGSYLVSMDAMLSYEEYSEV